MISCLCGVDAAVLFPSSSGDDVSAFFSTPVVMTPLCYSTGDDGTVASHFSGVDVTVFSLQ